MLARSRRLRKESTVPERLLWSHLRNRQLNNLKFRRQHVVGAFVVDFVCESVALVVELDGESHVGQGVKDNDRSAYLKQNGYRVLRVTNDDVIGGIEAVLLAIERAAMGEGDD